MQVAHSAYLEWRRTKPCDMASFSLAFASRDESAYTNAREVDLVRRVTRHLSFGGGPHRCLGSHLARQEMAVVLEEWHKRIPDYELVGEATIKHGGQVFGVGSLNSNGIDVSVPRPQDRMIPSVQI
ncbi:hypothetical protein N602_26585 [Mycobacterium avium subsp. hominissuis 10-5606]|nr:hypothetical protein N602_26585 [Mycobacterium avium subsp. hominissuis 10-5606]